MEFSTSLTQSYRDKITIFAENCSGMIISLRLANFYSMKDDAVLDFTADTSSRKLKDVLPENLIEFAGDSFLNIVGLFGSNAAGKSNMIKAIDFCRNLILTSHLNNEGSEFDFEPFKFDVDKPSEFSIEFITGGIEYEYSFTLYKGSVLRESLYHYPNRRKAKVFVRDNGSYTYGKGAILRPAEVEANTGSKTLFLSRASSMNRSLAKTVYRFFLKEMVVGAGGFDLSSITEEEFLDSKEMLLKAFEVSDSDIVDIDMVKDGTGRIKLQTFHRENPTIPFDFEKEESDGTKRLFFIMLMLLRRILNGAAVFLDEFDLKLHIRLAEFILDVVRASEGAQMVFTSHNPLLIDMTKLRREQIVLVSKQDNGNSEFIPLSDYELGKNTDVLKAYMQGRFDAVPYVGDIHTILPEKVGR